MHRDLKPANFVYNGKKVVLIDFGMACRIPKNDELTLTASYGSPAYMSPEKLNRGNYNSKSDIWSLGVTFYEILHGSLPFNGRTDD